MASDYAMSTKARSFYSQHLTAAHYRSMLEMPDIPGIASFLKNETRYSDVLEGINEKGIHRGFFEQRIRLKSHLEFLSLMRFIQTSKHHFYEFYVREVEIAQIIFILHAIDAGTSHFVEDFVEDLNHLMSFDVYGLAQCTTFEEVYKYLEHTSYNKPLAFLTDNVVDISKCEDSLKIFYNQRMLDLIRHEPNNKELLEVFRINIELENISNVYRMKKYFNMTSTEILKRVHYEPYYISENRLQEWILNLDADSFLEAFKETPYGKYEDFEGDRHIEYYFDMIRYSILKRKIRFSTNSDVILFSYMFLIKIEIENIIDVVEGVRYQMSPEEIVKLLII
ncbi:V-type ATPase subunit [Erysipelothrix amsterdamensis]|uniref:V-type ATPase subunit n=2 Tax=Erysipelothrix amsterdamensis TaxID=2929157 RepID=A0AAU9VHY3_9FIRM|nr:V-type ATPase subunit [Erysipelothrix sp. A18Y020d]CAH2762899.1 V-type ATPase subunit [Erysipelothrix sp. A18Y020d]